MILYRSSVAGFFVLKPCIRICSLDYTFFHISRNGCLYSPAEIQDDLAIASIENVFVYSNRYGHSDIKSA